jgi:hypothetical protein
MSKPNDSADNCGSSRCSQAVRRFEFVLMDDGVTIRPYECSSGRYVLLDDIKRQDVAALDELGVSFRDAGKKAEAATNTPLREYYRGVQDGLMAWLAVKVFSCLRS